MRILHFISSAIIFFGLSSSALGQATPSDAQGIFERARSAYLAKDYETAKRELGLAVSARTDWPEAILLEGLIAWQEGKLTAAIKSAKDAIRLQPVFPVAHYSLAQMFFDQGKANDAFKEVSLALTQGEQSANTYVLLGDIELFRHKTKEVISAYEKALQQPAPNQEVTPELKMRLEGLRNTAEITRRLGEPGFERPQRLNPSTNSPSSSFELGCLLNEQGRFVNVIVISSAQEIGGKEKLLEMVSQYKFSPAKKDGKPVPFWFYLSVNR